MEKTKSEEREGVEGEALLGLLADLLATKQDALRDLSQAVQVASDALQPLAEKKPVSVAGQRALVTIALMSLGQATEALEALGIVVKESGAYFTRREHLS